ncbi:hypothetical protein PRIPAC_82172 [Pristionchus pacificus]|nr:hypothetical protein PRIPAC_82172 [Pristionchus pacificus]
METTAFTLEDIAKLVMIMGIGGIICTIGIILNTSLLFVFSRLRIRNTNLIYLAVLACFDIGVEICFIFVFIGKLVWEYFGNYSVYLLWHDYVPVVSTIGQTVIASSVYFIVAASLDRYMTSIGRKFKSQHRILAISCAVMIGCLTKLPFYLEVEKVINEECDGNFGYVDISRTNITKSEFYSQVYMFYTRNIVNVFLPFLLLLLFNLAAVHNLSRQRRPDVLIESPSLMGHTNVNNRSSLKDASRTLIVLVTTYLLTNVLNLCITLVEFIHPDLTQQHDKWYTFLSDLSSILAVSATSLRLPVYFATNGMMRSHIRQIFFPSLRKSDII